MAARKTSRADVQVGRFYELQQELSATRRGPYQLTEAISIPPLTLAQSRAIRKANSDDEQLKILLGEHFAAIIALYDDRPLDEWLAFQNDLYAHFFGQGARELPGGSSGS
ncbi:hypothetical protein [Nocardia terpenica]|uniref:Uncharacterized protein n=1 Tax=Nocardia terpenica TaxID=455432 RepID=A0A164H1M6_9NOCA|nr:hypothetical protein [Nocardia terpenica]KZM68126.1 hypothetical protein AWN90_09295 [Nocardia terpenica]NQE89016.1 hypothetical protein [Nocardia terpenica]